MDERLATPQDRFASLRVSTDVAVLDGASKLAPIRGK